MTKPVTFSPVVTRHIQLLMLATAVIGASLALSILQLPLSSAYCKLIIGTCSIGIAATLGSSVYAYIQEKRRVTETASRPHP